MARTDRARRRRTELRYIDPLVSLFAEYGKKGVPITLVIEPDSLPNLVTNGHDPRCGNAATEAAYKKGISYAVEQFATHTSAIMYLDGAHGGWLGWDNNMKQFAELMADLKSDSTGIHTWTHLRGFSTNVAGYQQVGTTACPADVRNTDKILKYCSLAGKGTATRTHRPRPVRRGAGRCGRTSETSR